MAVISAISAIIWSCVLLDSAHGFPQFLVTSGKPKCFSVEVPKETMVKIHYEAPDIDVEKKLEEIRSILYNVGRETNRNP